MQGVRNDVEEGEQYMTTGEDGRPYVAVRGKVEEDKGKLQREDKPEHDDGEEEEQYMTIGEDGRPYIAIRR